MPQSSETPILSMSHISHAFDDTLILKDFSLDISKGETVCLLGASGCGKTTVLRLAAGLETLQQGQISLQGHPVSRTDMHVPAEKRDIGLVFQDYALFPHLNVRDNILFGIRKAKLRAEEVEERLHQVSTLVQMTDFLEAYPHMLSGGQQQRIALARALAPKPELLLLDEPYSGLDSRLRDQLREETALVLADQGIATLMVTHDPEEAMYLSDRIALMNQGQIEQIDSPEQIHHRPLSLYVAQFLSEVNRYQFPSKGGEIITPFGILWAPETLSVTDVGQAPISAKKTVENADVIIRPEDIAIIKKSQDNTSYRAFIDQSRLLGNQTVIFLRVEWQGRRFDMRVRQWGISHWEIGEQVNFVVDQSKLFVYAS